VALLAAAYLLLLGGMRTGVTGPRPSILQSLRDLPSLVRRRQLSASLTYVLADMTILHLWLVYLPLYLVQQWEYTLVAVGSLISIEALAYAFSQPIWGRILDRGRPQLSIVLSLAAHGLLISLVPLAGGSWPTLVVVLIACGALNAATYPGCVALTAARVHDTERGRAMGLLSSTSDVGQIVGPLVWWSCWVAAQRLRLSQRLAWLSLASPEASCSTGEVQRLGRPELARPIRIELGVDRRTRRPVSS
jgi:MFS family permease